MTDKLPTFLSSPSKKEKKKFPKANSNVSVNKLFLLSGANGERNSYHSLENHYENSPTYFFASAKIKVIHHNAIRTVTPHTFFSIHPMPILHLNSIKTGMFIYEKNDFVT